MNNIISIIKDYVETEKTNYAILFDGKWGCGKTYYLKNILKPKLEEIKNSKNENYKLVYVSLNGLSNTQSISTAIISSNLGIDQKGKLTKILFSSSDLLLNATSKFLKIDDYFNNSSEIDFSQLINYENKILCFDDIERISPQMKISEVLGYINTNFVEHNNIKVIIIGDIAKTREHDEIKKISEKLIGRTIKFYHTYDEIIEIISSHYNSEKDFLSFLEKHLDFIKSLLEEYKTTNLRTIFFFTELLYKYFNEKTPINDETWEKIILFSLVLSIEFRNNTFLTNEKAKKKELIDLSNIFFLLELTRKNSDGKDNTPPEFIERISKTYFNNKIGKYHFYYSVYTHIVDGYFDKEMFKKEFTISESDKYIHAVDLLNDYYLLTEQELNETVELIIDGLKEGVYELYYHEVIYQKLLLLVSDKVISQSKEEIKELVFNSIEIAKKRESDFTIDGMEKYGFYAESFSVSREVFKKIETIHENYFENKKKELVYSIITRLNEEKGSFSDILHSFYEVSFSNFFDSEQLISEISKSTNYSLTKFFRFINEKYRYDNYKTVEDIHLIQKLEQGLINIIEHKEPPPIQKAILTKGIEKLNKIIIEFNKKKSEQTVL